MFVAPKQTPVDRLVHSAAEYLKKHPDDAEAHYTLGRIYYLAFSMKRDAIPAYPDDKTTGQPRPADESLTTLTPEDKTVHPIDSKEDLLRYAILAKHEFDEAIRLDPKNALHYLGLGSLLEEVNNLGYWSPDLQPTTVHRLRQIYGKTFSLSEAEDSKVKAIPISGLSSLVSYEAALHLVQLATQTRFEGTELPEVQRALETIAKAEKLPAGMITPIVFSFYPSQHLSDYLAPQTVVDFDLRGYGYHEQWTWVKPTLGFLVWDPAHTGKITSAQQLFGGYTFQIFRKNGYDALSALDDNGDGVLSGHELKGISVWFDRNSNGVSEPGEVTTVQDLGIRAIATTVEGFDGIHPTNAKGLVLNDGRVLQSWDWITKPLQEKDARLAATETR